MYCTIEVGQSMVSVEKTKARWWDRVWEGRNPTMQIRRSKILLRELLFIVKYSQVRLLKFKLNRLKVGLFLTC